MRNAEQIDQILSSSLDKYMKQHGVPGIAVGVVLDGKLAYAKGFGAADLEKGNPVTAESMFHSASISKTFVATSLMQLWEKDKLDLDKTVVDYLPYFKLKDERYKHITVKQMMSHISGMPDVYDYEWDKPKYDENALENYVRDTYDFELLWEPGTKYSYSNLAYEILGDVIAKVSGMSFEDYVKRNILNPLGMGHSSFLIKEIDKGQITSPHVLDLRHGYQGRVNDYYPYNRIHAPSSTLWSSVKELCNYAIANLNRGSLAGYQMLQTETYNLMWQPYAVVNQLGTKIGLSWFLRQHKGENIIFHTGGDTGYASNLVLIPDKNAAFAFYCNCDYGNLNMLTEHILDILLGFEVQPIIPSAVPEIARAIHESGIEVGRARFEEIRVLDNKEYIIGEIEFNRFAYQYMNIGKLEEAITVLELAISELPKAANLYDSLGEMLLEKGDVEKAVENYRKALEIDPAMNSAITALKKLKIEI